MNKMRRVNLLFFVMVAAVGSGWAQADSLQRPVHDYAVLIVQRCTATTEFVIHYSNGQYEDFKKANKLEAAEIQYYPLGSLSPLQVEKENKIYFNTLFSAVEYLEKKGYSLVSTYTMDSGVHYMFKKSGNL